MVNIILLLGSSTISKWKSFTLQTKKEEVVVNRGISKLTSSSLLSNNYFDYIISGIKRQPKYIVFYCGINDIFDNVENKTIINNIRIFLQNLHKIFPTSKIIVISIIKSPKVYKENKEYDVDYINNRIRDFCSISIMKPYLHYVNVNKVLYSSINNYFMNDGLHLNEIGYEKINKRILQIIT